MSITHWDPKQTVWTFAGYKKEKKNEKDYWLPSHFDVIDDNGKWGCNYRMNESQAAVGRAQLRKIDMLIDKRRENSHFLNDAFNKIKGIRGVYEDPNCYHSYHLYTLLIKEDELGCSRDDFMRVMYQEEGIQGIQHYQPNYHFSGLKKKYKYPDKLCPVAERFFYNEQTNLPMNPRLSKNDLEMMVAGIKNTVKKVQR